MEIYRAGSKKRILDLPPSFSANKNAANGRERKEGEDLGAKLINGGVGFVWGGDVRYLGLVGGDQTQERGLKSLLKIITTRIMRVTSLLFPTRLFGWAGGAGGVCSEVTDGAV